ncbi:hypothetical protein HPB47_024897 [Ixodes persulcatus]|uniref:Uncharacterized protein n=1 Tax=Ixodes persulcatus TaxID=34615 RepID=A0AC60Q476_IXOPE|nr:hypothetical protein HPB47_024897 [Ixodes persulcatus]
MSTRPAAALRGNDFQTRKVPCLATVADPEHSRVPVKQQTIALNTYTRRRYEDCQTVPITTAAPATKALLPAEGNGQPEQPPPPGTEMIIPALYDHLGHPRRPGTPSGPVVQPRLAVDMNAQVAEPLRGFAMNTHRPAIPPQSYTEDEGRLLCSLCGVSEIHRCTHRAGALHRSRESAAAARAAILHLERTGEDDLARAIAVIRRLLPALLHPHFTQTCHQQTLWRSP